MKPDIARKQVPLKWTKVELTSWLYHAGFWEEFGYNEERTREEPESEATSWFI